jgi:hypothetical protein
MLWLIVRAIIFLHEYYVVQAVQIAGRFPATLRLLYLYRPLCRILEGFPPFSVRIPSKVGIPIRQQADTCVLLPLSASREKTLEIIFTLRILRLYSAQSPPPACPGHAKFTRPGNKDQRAATLHRVA